MEASSSAKESVATPASTEIRETSISTVEYPSEGHARDVGPIAECEPLHEHLASSQKDENKTSFSEDIAITKVYSQIDNVETSTMEATADPKAIDAPPQEKELENAEITLVVEMSTDAELSRDTGQKEEEIIEHARDATSSVPALEQVGSEDSETGKPGTSPKAAHLLIAKSTEMIQQQSLVCSLTPIQQTQDCSASSKMHALVGRELERIEIQKEVVAEDHTSLAVSNEIKRLESKGEEDQPLVKVQTKEAFVSLHIEGALSSAIGLETKPLNLVTASGSSERLITNDEAITKQDVGDLSELEVEAKSEFRPCRKRAVEEHVEEYGLHMSELPEGVVDGERKKCRMATGESLQPTEQSRAEVLETQSDPFTCNKAKGEGNFAQGLESGLGEEVTDISKEQGAGSILVQTELRVTDIRREHDSCSTLVQTELRVDKSNLGTEVVQPGSPQSIEGRDKVQEGINSVEGIAVLTEEVIDKDVVRDVGKSFVRMETGTAIGQHVEIMVEEGTQGGRQNLLFEKEPSTFEKNIDISCRQSYEDIKSCAALAARQEVMEGNKFQQGNNGADEMDVSVGHIEVGSSKVVKAGQEIRREEVTPHLFRQDTQVTSAIETSHTDVLQLERQQNQKVLTEMHVRLAETPHEVLEGSSQRVSRELSLARSKEVKEEEPGSSIGQRWRVGIVMKVKSKADTPLEEHLEGHAKDVFEERQGWAFQGTGYDNVVHQSGRRVFEEEKTGLSDDANTGTSEEERFFGGQLERGSIIGKASQKRKLSDNLNSDGGVANEPGQNDNVIKKAKKKVVNVWAKSTSRKGPKKNSKNGGPQNPSTEDSVLLTPVYVNPDKVEDGPDQPIALSKTDKAEKIELSENRLSASSTKGYRMVRATRGVQEGTWYYEIVVEQLGPTGHTRLGWSTQKGDVQAPVGFDGNSYGYRDLDGSKTHVAIREQYGDLYVEGDVIGFYIHLPNGAEYAPKPAPVLSYRGRPYLSDVKEEQPRRVPGSEICFFRNGVCQGTAFKDIYGGRYFPAASMYTLPKEPNCTVRFNFGPDFRYPPVDLDARPAPIAMAYAPYHNALSGKEVGPVAYANISATGHGIQNIEPQM